MHPKLSSKNKIFILFVALFFILHAFVEQAEAKPIAGRIVDAQSGEPLAFVHILIQHTRQGAMSDIDGHFSLNYSGAKVSLQLSYVGYHTKTYKVEDFSKVHYIQLHRQQIDLSEVVVYPGENPAHRIIRNVMDNRNSNHPERLSSFTYNSYNKFVATLARDYYLEKWEHTGDSVNKRMIDFLDKRHVFILESVTERKFRYPGRKSEKVIANRVSGLENPLFSMLATELQSFSFYDNYTSILGNDYLSPLNRTAFNRYRYYLEDTLYQELDSVFVIAFRPHEGANFDGMEGVLYVSTDGWALQNVIASPSRELEAGMNFRIQQKYEKVQGKKWFPVQLNTDIDLYNPRSFDEGGLPPIRILSRSYIQNIEINPSLSRRDFSAFGVDFDPKANTVDPEYWNKYRQDSLSAKEYSTYHYMDSLGRAHNFDGLANFAGLIFSGEIPLGEFSMPLNRFYRYNQYEKHRIGLGLHSNYRLSQRFTLGGHYAWGTGDEQQKYRYFGEVVLDKMTDLRLGIAQSYDVAERGGANFMERHFVLSPYNIRNLYTGVMDITQRSSVYISFLSWMNFVQTELSASRGRTYWKDLYYFVPSHEPRGVRSFRFTEAAMRLRFAYGETLINTPMQLMHIPSKYPIFYLNITKGFDNIDRGEYDYLKLEAKLDLSYRIPLVGRQNWVLESGWIDNNDLPWPLLFSARSGDNRALLAAPFSFGTMGMNEFIVHQYFSLFFQHSFESLLLRNPGYEPELVLIHNMGWGTLENSQNHIYRQVKSMEKGYFESGLAINRLLPQRWVRKVLIGFSPGIEVLYRYGPYSFDKNRDNLTLKMSLTTKF